jgi:hypothetical protein
VAQTVHTQRRTGADHIKYAALRSSAVDVDRIKMTVTLTATVSGDQIEVMPANFDALAAEFGERAEPPGPSA